MSTTTRTAVVTGGEGSIGHELVSLLLARGIRVISADRCPSGAPLPSGTDNLYSFHSYEAQDPASAEALISTAEHIDYLVLAAGIYPESALSAMADEDWQRTIDVNLTGSYLMLQRSLPVLAQDASVVLLSSIAGMRGSRNHAHYAASKAGLLGLARSVMWELGSARRINVVSPGIIDNTMSAELRGTTGERILANTPMGRYGTPQEIATVLDFLCSEASAFIQGENINVNGGFHVG